MRRERTKKETRFKGKEKKVSSKGEEKEERKGNKRLFAF